MSKIEEIAEREASAICEELGLYVYEVEYKKEGSDYCLRVFVDSDTGITLDECEKVSRALSDKLDTLDPVKNPYELEISSPGIERLLTRDWHFDKVIGSEIEVNLFKPIDGAKKIRGILTFADSTHFKLETEGKSLEIDKKDASQIKTVFNF